MSVLRQKQTVIFLVILLLHLSAIYLLSRQYLTPSSANRMRLQFVFIPINHPSLASSQTRPSKPITTSRNFEKEKKSTKVTRNSLVSNNLHSAAHTNNTPAKSEPNTAPEKAKETVQDAVPSIDNPSSNKTLKRDIARISQLLERDLRFEDQKLQAAKPPNQLVREYWEKQNHPYKDKWDQLAHQIEKAGKARDASVETFKAWDGTLITKIDGRCYKSPDPGRTYLHQPEVRQVICTR